MESWKTSDEGWKGEQGESASLAMSLRWKTVVSRDEACSHPVCRTYSTLILCRIHKVPSRGPASLHLDSPHHAPLSFLFPHDPTHRRAPPPSHRSRHFLIDYVHLARTPPTSRPDELPSPARGGRAEQTLGGAQAHRTRVGGHLESRTRRRWRRCSRRSGRARR